MVFELLLYSQDLSLPPLIIKKRVSSMTCGTRAAARAGQPRMPRGTLWRGEPGSDAALRESAHAGGFALPALDGSEGKQGCRLLDVGGAGSAGF
ncbi:hypothetical protein CKO25_04535 [Thiocapsa imhoffii]|uniref:Uncharacterized protein n=1 Tax=Thiocapsa imhoffii TaxID=382777 RepID=A0A9X0WG43_9GAMM|nr:hypothetical protein [Thiocapsa imhoffii]